MNRTPESAEANAILTRAGLSKPEPATPWRRLPFSDAPMGRQLALSEAMLADLPQTGRPALRWYIPTEPALVLGNGQKPSLADAESIREREARIYRRTSGGTAVYVTPDLLSFDVALPPTHPLATNDVVRAYQWIGELWEDALHALGIAKVRALPTEEVRALPPIAKDDPLRLACYGTLSPWEVAAGRRKVVGLCQVRRKAGALYQVGVYLHFDPKTLPALLDLNHNTRKVLGTRLHNAVAGLDTLAGRDVTADEVIAAVENTLSTRYGARIEPSQWSQEELREADRIERERFLAFV